MSLRLVHVAKSPVVTGEMRRGWGPVRVRDPLWRVRGAGAVALWAFVTRCEGRSALGLGPRGHVVTRCDGRSALGLGPRENS